MDGAEDPPPRGALAGIGSYALYYGRGYLDSLAAFDLAVLEPRAWIPEDIHLLRERGTRVLAYMSTLEVGVDEFNPSGGYELLHVEGQPLLNHVYNNLLLVPSRHRSETLAAQAQRLIRDYDGVFLDTLGAVEDERIPPDRRLELAIGAGHLVRQLRSACPGAVIVQNMGIWGVHRFTRNYVDGLCWESFPASLSSAPAWLDAKAGELAAWSAGTARRILLLVQDGPLADDEWLSSWASSRGWPVYLAPGDYTTGIGRSLPARGQQ
ncbi:MAG: hypothetical protein RDU89_00450 [bacterium]|nr:hypothetical protein [bacterium]